MKGNAEMNIRKITINTDCINMSANFESAVVHLPNFIPEVRSLHGISYVETELEVKLSTERGRSTPYFKRNLLQ